MINNGTVSVSGSDAKNRLVVGMIFDQINNFKTKIDKPMIRRMPRNMLKCFFIFSLCLSYCFSFSIYYNYIVSHQFR